ncbi:MAG TPA: hypothetical protein VMT03_20015 [Polyangia bacterium]|nr:hypothetical protein [Polyangia bacterium]
MFIAQILLSSAAVLATGALPSSPATASQPQREAVCAVEIPSMRVTATDFSVVRGSGATPGIVLQYTAQAGLTGSVRRLVRRYAAVQNGGVPVAEHFGDPRLARGVAGAPPGTAVLVPGAHASVADTPAGARLTLMPVTPEMRRLLHAAARRQRQSASQRPCPPDVRLNPDGPDRNGPIPPADGPR